MDINEAVEKIKSSKKYMHISEEIIREQVQNYFQKIGTEDLDEKIALKEIKTQLHKIHGGFRFKSQNFDELINNKDFEGILKATRSTHERINLYGEIYDKIFAITGKPKIIMDLGAGLNPFSMDYMTFGENIEYYAYDINEAEIQAINKFLELENIAGKAEVLDLSKIENVKKLPKADLCFMFKLIDTLEQFDSGHKYAEEMIKVLAEKCRFIVVSFATKTLSGKRMKFAERGWIERMLERIKLRFDKLVFEQAGEVFYIIKS